MLLATKRSWRLPSRYTRTSRTLSALGKGVRKGGPRRGSPKRRSHYTTKPEEGSNLQSSIVEAELLTQTRERLQCLFRPFLTLRYIGQHVPAVDAVVRADLVGRNLALFQDLGEMRTRYV
jgi:hypothetical protein